MIDKYTFVVSSRRQRAILSSFSYYHWHRIFDTSLYYYQYARSALLLVTVFILLNNRLASARACRLHWCEKSVSRIEQSSAALRFCFHLCLQPRFSHAITPIFLVLLSIGLMPVRAAATLFFASFDFNVVGKNNTYFISRDMSLLHFPLLYFIFKIFFIARRLPYTKLWSRLCASYYRHMASPLRLSRCFFLHCSLLTPTTITEFTYA